MKFIEYLIWILYPKRCAVCGKIIEKDASLCDECDKKLERVEENCSVCGSMKKHCECKRYVYRFSGLVASFYKAENSMKMIYRFKLHGKTDSLGFLADSVTDKINRYYKDIRFDIVTSVPMSKIKKFCKGFNHSELIAKAVAKRMGVEYKNLLNKKPFCRSQHNLKREERFENVKDMFSSSNNVSYKKVLLIDDIKTTGATLNECTKQLLFAKVEEVYCATVITSVLGLGIEKE